MDTPTKPPHLKPAEMESLLSKIGYAGILRAVAAWSEGERPNQGRFRKPNGWWVVVGRKKFPHRPLIALACEMVRERVMRSNNFGKPNDDICKKWFDQELNLKIRPVKSSTQ